MQVYFLFVALRTNFSEIWIEIWRFSFKKMHLKISSAKWWTSCLGLNVLKKSNPSGAEPGGGGGTPYVMGDTYVPRFWPPFITLAGSSTIFLGYFSHPPTAKLSFGVQKLPIFTKIDLFGPKFNFFLDLFGSNFQRPAAHPHQFSGRVPPPPPGAETGILWKKYILWLLMIWLIALPGHLQTWYWICRKNIPVFHKVRF